MKSGMLLTELPSELTNIVQAERRAEKNDIGVSRGGRTTKIHARVDAAGFPLQIELTPGSTHDGQSGSSFDRNAQQ